MTKLYFIFLLCALTSAGAKDVRGMRQSAYGVGGGARQDSGSYGSQSNLNQATSSKTDSASSGSDSPSGYSDPGASRSYSGISSPSGYTGSVASRGYSGSSSYTGSSSTNDQDSSVDYSGSASRSGSNGNSAQTQQQDYSGTTRTLAYTSSDKDHNGLSENEVSELVAAANRRRMQRPLYMTPNRARLMAPKRYGSLPPRYSSNLPLYGRSGDDAALDLVSNYGSAGTNTGSSYGVELRQQQDTSNNAGSGYGSGANENNANREGQQGLNGNSYLTSQSATSSGKSDSSESNQNAAQETLDSSRRFYLPNGFGINPYNPYPTNNNPLDPFADLNNENYLKAFGPYGK